MNKKYYINGWQESRGYFLSHGFTTDEIDRMERGEILNRDGNEYRIDIRD